MTRLLGKINYDDLTVTEQLIFDFFIEHSKAIVAMSLQDLCDQLYVSNASIIRFCQKLGYKGYNEFKFDVKKRMFAAQSESELWQCIPRNTEVLKDFLDTIDEKMINEICDAILGSDSVYIYGRTVSSLPAKYLHSMLNTMDIPSIFIDWFDFLSSISQTLPEYATLILFTTHGQKEIYQSIIDSCHKRKIKIIWISSDSVDPCLIDEKDIYICVHESKVQDSHLMMKMTSFLLVQLIIEVLISRKKLK